MTKIPKFKSEDEEFDFWSTHSFLEFEDEGEEVEIDASEARRKCAARMEFQRACRTVTYRTSFIPIVIKSSIASQTETFHSSASS